MKIVDKFFIEHLVQDSYLFSAVLQRNYFTINKDSVTFFSTPAISNITMVF